MQKAFPIQRINTHFHPNFGKFAKRKAKKIWQKFAETKLDVVIVTEHAFRNPVRACKLLEYYKPENAKTRLIFGVEALTKEGIDVIVFAAGEYIFSQDDILKPYQLSFQELMTRVEQDIKLHMIITHPYIPSKSALCRHVSDQEIQELIAQCNVVEKYNAAFLALQQGLSHSPRWKKIASKMIKPSVHREIQNSMNLPTENISETVTCLGGGDEHHVRDIGSYLEVPLSEIPDTDEGLIECIVSLGSDGNFVHKEYTRFEAFVSGSRQVVTIVREGIHRRFLKNILRIPGMGDTIFRFQQKRIERNRKFRKSTVKRPLMQRFSQGYRNIQVRSRQFFRNVKWRPKNSNVQRVRPELQEQREE